MFIVVVCCSDGNTCKLILFKIKCGSIKEQLFERTTFRRIVIEIVVKTNFRTTLCPLRAEKRADVLTSALVKIFILNHF